MKSSLTKLLLILLLLFLLLIPSVNAATLYSYDAAGNLVGTSSSQSVLTTLTLSGSSSLTYNGSNLSFDLTTLTLSGVDQSGYPFDLSKQTVTWAVASGPATVLGSTLTITNSGTISIIASVGTITSNTLCFTVARAPSALSSLALSGSPSPSLV